MSGLGGNSCELWLMYVHTPHWWCCIHFFFFYVLLVPNMIQFTLVERNAKCNKSWQTTNFVFLVQRSLGRTKKIFCFQSLDRPIFWGNRFFLAHHTSFIPVSRLVPCCCSLWHVLTDHWLIHVGPWLSSLLPATLSLDKSMLWNGYATLLSYIWWVRSG